MTRVKICGMTRRKDINISVNAGADALGFVTDVPVETPRNLEPEEAHDLVEHVPPFVTSVLVIMPSSTEHALDLVRKIEPDAVQIHNDLPPDGVLDLFETGVKVIKRVPPNTEDASEYSFVDAFIVDSMGEGGGGGTGETHDWIKTAEFREDVNTPLILAGGLTPNNVVDGVREVMPYAVDVSSGVEWKGEKHAPLIQDFVENAKSTGGMDV